MLNSQYHVYLQWSLLCIFEVVLGGKTWKQVKCYVYNKVPWINICTCLKVFISHLLGLETFVLFIFFLYLHNRYWFKKSGWPIDNKSYGVLQTQLLCEPWQITKLLWSSVFKLLKQTPTHSVIVNLNKIIYI